MPRECGAACKLCDPERVQPFMGSGGENGRGQSRPADSPAFRGATVEWLKEAGQKAVAQPATKSGRNSRHYGAGGEARTGWAVGRNGQPDGHRRKGHGYLTLVNDLARRRAEGTAGPAG